MVSSRELTHEICHALRADDQRLFSFVRLRSPCPVLGMAQRLLVFQMQGRGHPQKRFS